MKSFQFSSFSLHLWEKEAAAAARSNNLLFRGHVLIIQRVFWTNLSTKYIKNTVYIQRTCHHAPRLASKSRKGHITFSCHHVYPLFPPYSTSTYARKAITIINNLDRFCKRYFFFNLSLSHMCNIVMRAGGLAYVDITEQINVDYYLLTINFIFLSLLLIICSHMCEEADHLSSNMASRL